MTLTDHKLCIEWTRKKPLNLCTASTATMMLCMTCPQFLHGGWPEGLPHDEGPQRYGTKRAEWVRVDQV